jgi:DNA-binding HxlR family transcriptional regulator
MLPKHTPIRSRDCPTREVLNRIGNKWSILVVRLLREGPKRFNELRGLSDGISQRMLTLTLRGLERDGIVKRMITLTVPPRVDYELTPMGRSLLKPIMAMAVWSDENRAAIQESRKRYDMKVLNRVKAAEPKIKS